MVLGIYFYPEFICSVVRLLIVGSNICSKTTHSGSNLSSNITHFKIEW
jgi:hypothetical protein